MHRQIRWLTALVLGVCVMLAAAPIGGVQAQSSQQCFPETGFCISGRILDFWNQNGGLPVFGLPITPQQTMTIEGRSLQIQWFQRARLELHPENKTPYDVLLGRLGVDRLVQEGRDWFSFPKTAPQSGCLYFAVTAHNICGLFLSAWRANGLEFDGKPGKSQAENLALFGLPLSDPMTETIEGKPYSVQWFERARLELHPENQAPYNVLGGLLGSEVYAGGSPVPLPTPVPSTTGHIVYLDPDGITIRQIGTDGSNLQTVLSISKQANEQVTSLSADRTGTYLLYSLLSDQHGAEYYLVNNGAVKDIMAFASTPRWAPNRAAFVAQGYANTNGQGQAYLYDVAAGTNTPLAFNGIPDWFPDAAHLVYVGFHTTSSGVETGDIYSYDISAGKSTQLTNLTNLGGGAWAVQEAHVLPDGQHIIFFGGQQNQLGASGNGQQWWWIPSAGGTPTAFDNSGGNGVSSYSASPGGDLVGYATSTHVSACVSVGQIFVRTSSVQGGFSVSPPLPALSGNTNVYAYVKGLSWSPDNNYVAFAFQRYTCQNAANGPQVGATGIYTWNIRAANAVPGGIPRKLIDGSYPVWIK